MSYDNDNMPFDLSDITAADIFTVRPGVVQGPPYKTDAELNELAENILALMDLQGISTHGLRRQNTDLQMDESLKLELLAWLKRADRSAADNGF